MIRDYSIGSDVFSIYVLYALVLERLLGYSQNELRLH